MREPTRGLVVGCGGTLGFAWTAVALEAVETQLGWDARTADVLVGTSAGSEMAALLGSGRSVSSIVSALEGSGDDPIIAAHLAKHPGVVPPRPAVSWPARGLLGRGLRGELDTAAAAVAFLPRGRGDAGWLREFGTELANDDGWVDHAATWLVAADVRLGQRVAFGSPDAPPASLGQALAASWAIPGWFPPVTIGQESYLDGGSLSPTSGDLVLPLGLDEVVIIAPMSTHGGARARGLSRVERLLRRVMTRRVDREQRLLEAAGTRVIRVEPGAGELAVMGANFMDLQRRPATLATARMHTPARVRDAISRGAAA